MKKKTKKKERATIIIVIIIIILVAALIYFLRKNIKDKNNDVITSSGSETGTVTTVDGEEYVEEEKEEVYAQKYEDGSKVNTSSKIAEDRKVNGLDLTNFSLSMSGGQTLITADVTNNTGSDVTTITPINITLLDDEGNEIVTLGGIIGDVKNGETIQLKAETTLDFANAYDMKITVQE